jgi:hypothetical protein
MKADCSAEDALYMLGKCSTTDLCIPSPWFLEIVSLCSSGSLWTHYVTLANPELAILLHQCLKCWDYRCVPLPPWLTERSIWIVSFFPFAFRHLVFLFFLNLFIYFRGLGFELIASQLQSRCTQSGHSTFWAIHPSPFCSGYFGDGVSRTILPG